MTAFAATRPMGPTDYRPALDARCSVCARPDSAVAYCDFCDAPAAPMTLAERVLFGAVMLTSVSLSAVAIATIVGWFL